MFEQSVLSEAQTHKTWTVALAFAAQLAAVGVMILIPLLYIQPLPIEQLTTMLVVPPPPPPPPPPAAVRVARVVPKHFDPTRLVEPRTIPKTIAAIHDLPTAPPAIGVAGGIPGGVAGGQIGGVLGGILGSVPSVAPPPPPPPVKPAEPPKPATPDIIAMGGKVEAARLLSAPNPEYPRVDREARIQGKVVMDAIIGKDGHIENLTVVSGNALLVGAAMDAVKRWTYRPTYLNGRPVQVRTEIDIQFNLSS